MKPCEWCGEDVSGGGYGFLTYWDTKNHKRQGYWHLECWEEYWVHRKRPWYKKLWDKIRVVTKQRGEDNE